MAIVLRIRQPVEYVACRDWMRALTDRRAAGEIADVILMLEHLPVITVGRQRDAASHVISPGDTPVIEVERGGGPTWHGPGQLVAYPIVQLEGARKDLHRHLHALEDAVVDVLRDRGLDPGRDPRNTGVWLDCPDGQRRKVCSVGIACRRWVTWHGLALNVDPDWTGFRSIEPCGFDPDVMTRTADFVRGDLDSYADALGPALCRALDLPLDGRIDAADLDAAVALALPPPHLASAFALLQRAFPAGLGDRDVLDALRMLHPYLSNRNAAQLLGFFDSRPPGVLANEALRAGQDHDQGWAPSPSLRRRFADAGLDAWIAEAEAADVPIRSGL